MASCRRSAHGHRCHQRRPAISPHLCEPQGAQTVARGDKSSSAAGSLRLWSAFWFSGVTHADMLECPLRGADGELRRILEKSVDQYWAVKQPSFIDRLARILCPRVTFGGESLGNRTDRSRNWREDRNPQKPTGPSADRRSVYADRALGSSSSQITAPTHLLLLLLLTSHFAEVGRSS
jgi:hypothetical protein